MPRTPTEEKFVSLVKRHHGDDGAFASWNQSNYVKQVPEKYKAGVCAAASITFMYTSFLRGHDISSAEGIDLLKSYDGYMKAHAPQTKHIEEDFGKFQAQYEMADLEVYTFGFQYGPPEGSFPLVRSGEEKDFWLFHGKWNEKEKKYENADSKAYAKKLRVNQKDSERQDPLHPPLTFRKTIAWRGVKDTLLELQKIEEGTEEKLLGWERASKMMAEIGGNELTMVRRCTLYRQKKKDDEQEAPPAVRASEQLLAILSYHGAYFISVDSHAMACFVDRRRGKYKYFEPNAGIARFDTAKKLMDFAAEWLSTEYASTGNVAFYHFL